LTSSRQRFRAIALLVAVIVLGASPSRAQVFFELGLGATQMDEPWSEAFDRPALRGDATMGGRFLSILAITGSSSASLHGLKPELEGVLEIFWTYDFAGGVRVYPFGGGSPNDGVYAEIGAGRLEAQWTYSSDVAPLLGRPRTDSRRASTRYGEVGYRWRIGRSVWFAPRARCTWLQWTESPLGPSANSEEKVLSFAASLGFGP
jgi:hypothetical protein